MKEALLARPPEQKSDRLHLADIEPLVQGRIEVGEHEMVHIVAIWGRGKSIQFASTEPTSEYDGVTIPAGGMGIVDMQIAAMASSHHSGNGSDMMKAEALSYRGGISPHQAESVAQTYINSYHRGVLHGAAVYLTYFGHATDSELRTYFRWAEEDIQEQEKYKGKDIPLWSDELDQLHENELSNEQISKDEQVDQYDNGDDVLKVKYRKDRTQHYIQRDGTERILYPHTEIVNGQEVSYLSPTEAYEYQAEIVIFSADPKYFNLN